jgi:hypothetical protein
MTERQKEKTAKQPIVRHTRRTAPVEDTTRDIVDRGYNLNLISPQLPLRAESTPHQYRSRSRDQSRATPTMPGAFGNVGLSPMDQIKARLFAPSAAYPREIAMPSSGLRYMPPGHGMAELISAQE